MRLKAIAGSILCVGLLSLPAAAEARASIPTTISVDSEQVVGTKLQMIGHLTSPNPKCTRGRTVKVTFIYVDSGARPVDRDVTSDNGIWGGSGTGSGAAAGGIAVSSKTFGRRGHRRTCAAVKQTFQFD